jgi:hypothetical protein
MYLFSLFLVPLVLSFSFRTTTLKINALSMTVASLSLLYQAHTDDVCRKLALAGAMILNNFEGRVAMSISQIPDQQLFVLDLRNLPVSKLIGIAGQVHDNTNSDSALIHGSDDHLVFEEAGLYFSTSATVLKVYYKPGLSAHGKMTFFGKTAEFKASVSKEGVVFKGYIDNFRIGDLVVQSASGAPRRALTLR